MCPASAPASFPLGLCASGAETCRNLASASGLEHSLANALAADIFQMRSCARRLHVKRRQNTKQSQIGVCLGTQCWISKWHAKEAIATSLENWQKIWDQVIANNRPCAPAQSPMPSIWPLSSEGPNAPLDALAPRMAC